MSIFHPIRLYAANCLGLLLCSFFLTDFTLQPGLKLFSIIAAILTLLHILLRPILKLVSLPLLLITLGAFSFVINGIVLALLDFWLESITINGLIVLIYATLLISASHIAVRFMTQEKG